MEELVFYFFAGISILAAILVVIQRKAIYSALALIVCFGSLAALFFQLGAEFIAAVQVIVYAGAIMVLFLFVVMLVDPDSEMFTLNKLKKLVVISLPMAAFFAYVLLQTLPRFQSLSSSQISNLDLGAKGSVTVIGRSLFRDYLVPFEVTSILILVAVLGAIVLAKQRID